ncbi:MAG: hypothetical protein SWC96_12395 [Thermodesulfobacteriota bacterium]|nr:hypothetical protein [Thermodesulfobacteriota bacterium]
MTENNKKTAGTTVESLTAYFLKLYKIHLGLSQDSPSEIVPVGPYPPNPKLFTYDLRVEQRGEWVSRRLTLGRIAEDTGSRSSCFFAIFDKQLVIKVPPSPIKDFETYLAHIERDKRIARILAPRPCLIPGVSAILSRVHKFPRDHEIKGEQRENIYYEWLRYSTENQVFLKIDGKFAFFMDLAQHMFLPEVVALFHGQDKKMQQEITADVSILDAMDRFEGRYGMDQMGLGIELKEVLDGFENRARRALGQSVAALSGRHDMPRHWFFRHIAGMPPVKTTEELAAPEQEKLTALLNATVEENRQVIDDYLEMIRNHLRRSSASKLLLYMAAVTANLLEVLAWLKERGVAIRDIKPDNLLVAGDQTRFPVFLADPAQFAIGLIDFETAVVFKPENGKPVAQPMLGGTPPYATPLNLFANKLIAVVYKDLDRALYLQDWYAMAGLIYGILTGSQLFAKTARVFLALPKKIAEASKAGRSGAHIVAQVNRFFWESALAEFEAGTTARQADLSAIGVPLSESVAAMFVHELDMENRQAEVMIDGLIQRQVLFKSRANQEVLYSSSAAQVNRFAAKAGAVPGVDQASLGMLESICRLKGRMEANQAIQKRLKQIDPVFSVLEVLHLLFYRAAVFMYPETITQDRPAETPGASAAKKMP